MAQHKRGERIYIDAEELGRTVRELRLSANMSQQDLAFATTVAWRQLTGIQTTISFNWIRLLERGEVRSVNRDRIACVAEALHVPVTRLLPVKKIGQNETPGTTADLVVAFRRYGMTDKDIETLLPFIEQFAHGDDDVRVLVEKIYQNGHRPHG